MGDLHKVYIYGQPWPTVKRSQLYLNGNSTGTYIRGCTGGGGTGIRGRKGGRGGRSGGRGDGSGGRGGRERIWMGRDRGWESGKIGVGNLIVFIENGP